MTTSSNKEDFMSSLRQDFSELKESFLDENQKKRLESMKRFQRFFYLCTWLTKILFQKLTRTRKLLLILGLGLIFISRNQTDSNGYIVGGGLLLFIIMLELKDKLLAKDELLAGRAVQDALLPDENPKIPGWDVWLFTRSANDVGGDLVDYLKIDDQRFGLALGDVAGKGLPAALFSAKLQATLRALAPDFRSLAKLGQKINEIFHRDGLPNRFASLVYLEIKTDSGSVNLLNAGHMPPVFLKEGRVEEMSKGNSALGLTTNSKYDEQKFTLQNSETLIIYSDGLSEARNEQGEFYGTQQFFQLLSDFAELSSAEIGKKILFEIDHFIGSASVHDDLSLVILKRTET